MPRKPQPGDGEIMVEQANAGDDLAKSCLNLYQLHRSCPSDPAAHALFMHVFEEWAKREAGDVK